MWFFVTAPVLEEIGHRAKFVANRGKYTAQ